MRLTSPETLGLLQSAHLDVAGVNRRENTAGVVCTFEDLEKLQSLGVTYEVVEASCPLKGRAEALSDYTDPVEMMAFLDQVQEAYPALAKKIVLKDTLFEGQQQVAMLITKDVDEPNARPSFLMDGMHHAREVMTSEITKDAIDYLASRYESDPRVKNWVDKINIVVVPKVNPDGNMYVFTYDKWWRKNRDPLCGPGDLTGVDINRNYDFFWNACENSSGECSSLVYRGPSPASEPETQGMKELMDAVRATFGLTYHSYEETIYYPYGCTTADEAALFEQYASGLRDVLQDDQGHTGTYELPPYTTDGMLPDTAYGEYGTFTFLVEVNCCSFQPDYATWRDVTVQRQRAGWQYFLDQTLTAPQIRGQVTDARTAEPLRAQVGLSEVALTHSEPPRIASAGGVYHWLVPGGHTYHATFSLAGYCTQEHAIEVGSGPALLDVALEPSGTAVPGTPNPADGAKNVALLITLGWSDTGVQTYDVYFGTASDPPKVTTVTTNAYALPQALEEGKTYFWKVATSSSCGSATGPLWSFNTAPYQITGAAKQGNPFRLTVSGSGFTPACAVKIDGQTVPRTQYKDATSLLAKGGSALKAMVPKGTPVQITIEDPSGGSSNAFTFQW